MKTTIIDVDKYTINELKKMIPTLRIKTTMAGPEMWIGNNKVTKLDYIIETNGKYEIIAKRYYENMTIGEIIDKAKKLCDYVIE